MLDRELRHLKAESPIVLQIDVNEEDIRLDGHVRATASPRSPRAALAFTCKHGPLTYYCDAHPHWQDNLRAICLGLERLRLVEATGIISRGEQYTGFKALPGGIELPPATMTVEEAAAQMAAIDPIDRSPEEKRGWNHRLMTSKDYFHAVYRQCVSAYHADAPTGDRAKWDQLQRAADVLKNHHGIG